MARGRSLGHAPALDGIRGIAILLVFTAHTLIPASGRFDGGTLGVDLFFVLSGFLITTLLIDEWDNGGISFSRFYSRRARRLLPALIFLLGFYGLIKLLAQPDRWAHTLLEFVARLSYLANVIVAVGHQNDLLGFNFGHLWSLAQEEQFYLLWPPLLLLALRKGARPLTVLWLTGAVVVAINIDRVITLHTNPGRVWVSPDTHGDPILFGCAAAVIRSRLNLRLPPWAGPAAAVLLAGTLAFYDRSTSSVAYPITVPLFALASAVLILGVIEHPHALLARSVSISPLRFAGAISYAWYLWNSVTIGYYGPAIGAPVSVAAAALSYRFVETPFRRRRRPSKSSDAPAVPVIPQPASAA